MQRLYVEAFPGYNIFKLYKTACDLEKSFNYNGDVDIVMRDICNDWC